MSFERIQWVYNPPPTLAPGVPPASSAAAEAPSAGASHAAQLRARFDLLNETARYLESAILARSAGRGVVLDLASNPELRMALHRIYGSTPAGISIAMYNALLDAEIGMTRAEIALGETGAAYQVDPVQQHDVQMATQAFEKAMLADGGFDNQVPMMLRSLKNDRVVFDNLSAGLGTYSVLAQNTPQAAPGNGSSWTPPAAPLSAAPLDVNQDTTDNLNERLDAWQQNYSDNYRLISTPSTLYGGISQYSQSLSSQIAADLQVVLQIIRALEALFFQPTLQGLLQSIEMFVWAKLASEIGGFLLMIDQAVQKAEAPVQSLLSSFGRIFNEVAMQASVVSHLISQGAKIRDMVAKHSKPISPKVQADLNKIPKELGQIGGYIGWAQMAVMQKQTQVEVGSMKLLDIKLNFGQKHNQVLAALKDAEAVISILTAFLQVLSERQTSLMGTITQAEAATGIVEDGVIQYLQQSGANKTPKLPDPSAQVQQVFDGSIAHV